MFNLTYEEIIERIKREKGLSTIEIEEKIKSKLKNLSDLISKEGAAHIVANELGVKLINVFEKKKFKIKDIISGLSSVDIVGRVVSIYSIRTYNKNGREGKVANFLLGDETGTIRVVLWDTNHISEIEKGTLKEGIIVKLKNAYIKDNNGYPEVHLSNKGKIIFDVDEYVGEVNLELKPLYNLKSISSLTKEEYNIGVQGTLVQIFEPRFYDICPECNKKVNFEDNKFICLEHGEVIPKLAIFANFYLDDGTGNIRVTAFRDLASNLLNLKDLNELKSNPIIFNDIKESLIGKEVLIIGRVVKNMMFERYELLASKFEDVDPLELANELVGQIER